MSVDVNENVLRLDVTVDYVLFVKVFKAEQQLRKIEPSLIFREFLDFTEVEKHLAASAEIHNEEELGFRLK